MESQYTPGTETHIAERPAPRRRWGLSEWSIALLFAEPFVVGWGETSWQHYISGLWAPSWLTLATNRILKQVPLTVIAGTVVVVVLLLVTCFRYRQMRRFLRAYLAASLILAAPGSCILALLAARNGGIGAMIAHQQLTGRLSGNLLVDATSFVGAPWVIYFLCPWLFYDYLPFVFVLGLPLVYLNQILTVPFMLIVLCSPSGLMLPVFLSCVIAIAGYVFLPHEMKSWIRDWRDVTWERIRHRV
jgi:hypothetical protein